MVHKAHLKEDPTKKLAVKCVNKKGLSPKLLNNLKNEVHVLTRIKSPHVIQLLDLQRTENNYYLFMEICNGGDLETLKETRGGRFTELEARIILQQLV